MEHIGGTCARERLVQKRMEHLQEALAAVRELVADLEQEMSRLEGQKTKLRQEYREEILTAADYKEMRGDVEREQFALQDRLRELETTRRDLKASMGSLPTLVEQIDRLARWDGLDPHERKHLLRRFVDSLLVYKEPDGLIRCTITWTTGYSEEETTRLEFQSHAKRSRDGRSTILVGD